MEYRPYYLAKEWVKQGHQVTIVGATYSHLRLKQPVIERDLQNETIDGIRYVWLKTPAYVGSLARIYNMLTFVRKLYKYEDYFVNVFKPELVIASSTYPLDNYPAYKMAQKARAKYTYEVHDLWPLSPQLIGGYSKYHPFIWVMQRAEDFAYKHVDKVISLLWNAEAHMKEHGLAEGKFVCIPNGYFPEEWTEDTFNLPLPKEHQQTFDELKDKVIVGFAGGFAASGAVDTLVRAAVLLKEKPDIHVVLVGKGPEQPLYEQIIQENGLQNVSILPSVPKSLIPAINKHFDIAFLGGKHSPLHQYGTSYNKMTDYMLSAKPIVQAVDEPGSVVERVGCGMRVEAENIQTIADAIKQLAALSAADRKGLGEKGERYVRQHLPWDKLAARFINEFQ